jgi:hypothetical protein
MVIAQALGEYANVSSVVTAITDTWSSVVYYVNDIEPRTWVVGGIALLVLGFLWNRRR